MPIWTDALCISQFDVPERNQKVANMAKNYESVEEVLVWLGHADSTTENVVHALRRYSFSMDEWLEPTIKKVVRGTEERFRIEDWGATLAIERWKRKIGEELSCIGREAHYHRRSQAADPRDKILAIVGISSMPTMYNYPYNGVCLD